MIKNANGSTGSEFRGGAGAWEEEGKWHKNEESPSVTVEKAKILDLVVSGSTYNDKLKTYVLPGRTRRS